MRFLSIPIVLTTLALSTAAFAQQPAETEQNAAPVPMAKDQAPPTWNEEQCLATLEQIGPALDEENGALILKKFSQRCTYSETVCTKVQNLFMSPAIDDAFSQPLRTYFDEKC